MDPNSLSNYLVMFRRAMITSINKHDSENPDLKEFFKGIDALDPHTIMDSVTGDAILEKMKIPAVRTLVEETMRPLYALKEKDTLVYVIGRMLQGIDCFDANAQAINFDMNRSGAGSLYTQMMKNVNTPRENELLLTCANILYPNRHLLFVLTMFYKEV